MDHHLSEEEEVGNQHTGKKWPLTSEETLPLQQQEGRRTGQMQANMLDLGGNILLS